ncbi:MAG TPA: hypothetical protein VFU51_01770 [Gaiellaceae bacterium]|nr:hypothetical protein [Gaiellaceae bacterium]
MAVLLPPDPERLRFLWSGVSEQVFGGDEQVEHAVLSQFLFQAQLEALGAFPARH